MISSKKSVGFLSLGVSVLALSACSIGHPNAFPSGYTYHKQEYKSPAPTESYKITAKQRSNMDAAQAEQFRNAVYDLTTKITSRAGIPPKPVYVMMPDNMDLFYSNIDNDLRESMRHLGYAIADVPTGAYAFAYDARYIAPPKGAQPGTHPNVELIIKVFDVALPEANQLTREAGQYYIQGAEHLYIKPTNYSTLPSYKKIIEQLEGFNTMEDPRTAPALGIPYDVRRDAVMPPQDPIMTRKPSQDVILESDGETYKASRPTISKAVNF